MLCLAFVLPALLVTAVFALQGIYPFGEKSLLIADMDNEYIDYFVHLNRILREGGSFLRSWEMGMGLNMLGLIAFYTASPFLAISLLMPVELANEAVFLMTVLKIGLAGLLFAVYARYVFPEQRTCATLLFSTAYALMSYNIAYCSNLMWLDGTAFLPLVLLGAEKQLWENKHKLSVCSLVYVFLTSYYIGYMVGVFSFLYFTAACFIREWDIRGYLRKLWRFLLDALLAAGLSAFLLLPAFMMLKNGQSEMWQIPVSFRLRFPTLFLAAKLLPGVYDSLTDSGLPNIYCTAAAAYLFLLFFFNPAVPRRVKGIVGAWAGLLLACFSCEILDLGWHAFEDPTWYPARYSFIFSFLLLYGAMHCAERFGALRRGHLLGAAGILVFLWTEAALHRYAFLRGGQVIVGILLLLVYMVIALLLSGKWKRQAGALCAAALLLACGETGYNAYRLMSGMDRQLRYRSRAGYTQYRERYGPAVELAESLDEGIYRMEVLEQRNANGGMALGYKGISHYSTTTDQVLNLFLRRLGYNIGTSSELRFTRSTPLTNGLLGIKYVLTEGEMGGGYEKIGEAGAVSIYRNSAAFPLAFFAEGGTMAELSATPDPFNLQNEIIYSLYKPDGVQQIFTPVVSVLEQYGNLTKSEQKGFTQYERKARGEDAWVEYRIENPERRELFAFLPVYGRQFARVDASVNGGEWQREAAYRANTVLSLGSGEEIRLRLRIDSDYLRLSGRYFYALDLTAAQRLAELAQQNRVDFTRFSDTAVVGAVTATHGGALVTTFPYDEGWTVTVDGRRAEPCRFAGVFLALELEEGTHEIEMRYFPPGFRAGLAVSLLCAAGTGVYFISKACRRRDGSFFLRRKKNQKRPF